MVTPTPLLRRSPHRAYRLVARVGSGAIGDVWHAVHVQTGRNVALKVLRSRVPGGAESIAAEAQRLAREIGAPFVVQLLDYSLTQQPPFLVLEYMPGGNLRKYVSRRLPWSQAVMMLVHALHGVASIHRHGQIHRDLKPENLLLTQDGQYWTVKIADLGHAKMRAPAFGLGRVTSVVGTAGYVAPEILARQAETPARDVYSLGIVGRELLTGSRNHIAGWLPNVTNPREVVAIIEAMANQNPRLRPEPLATAVSLEAIARPHLK